MSIAKLAYSLAQARIVVSNTSFALLPRTNGLKMGSWIPEALYSSILSRQSEGVPAILVASTIASVMHRSAASISPFLNASAASAVSCSKPYEATSLL